MQGGSNSQIYRTCLVIVLFSVKLLAYGSIVRNILSKKLQYFFAFILTPSSNWERLIILLSTTLAQNITTPRSVIFKVVTISLRDPTPRSAIRFSQCTFITNNYYWEFSFTLHAHESPNVHVLLCNVYFDVGVYSYSHIFSKYSWYSEFSFFRLYNG